MDFPKDYSCRSKETLVDDSNATCSVSDRCIPENAARIPIIDERQSLLVNNTAKFVGDQVQSERIQMNVIRVKLFPRLQGGVHKAIED